MGRDCEVCSYRDELTKAMTMLGSHPNTIFIGQAVRFPGTAMYGTLEGVPMAKRIELPVFEDTQLGMATGMSLSGLLPVCIYPRINFLLLAINQLVSHLDKLPIYGNGWKPKVIIRTAVAHNHPMDPGVQHLGDYGHAIRQMLSTVKTVMLLRGQDVIPEYRKAAERDGSTLLIERASLYEEVS